MAPRTNVPAQDETPQVNTPTPEVADGQVEQVESTFNEVVKSLKKKFGNPKKCIVKNINFEEFESYRRVSFTLRNEVDGYRQDANGDWIKGKTNIIFSSAYAIAGVLKENDELAWLGNVILSNPNCMNLLFSAAELSIIQQEIPAGEDYINPFSSNGEATSKEYNWIVNHVIDIKLSKVGQKVYDKLMDNILSM